jgi:hypothetical protein
VVLFLQWMRLRYGTGTVLEGAAIAAVLIAAVGALTFVAHRRIPDKRMLAATGVLIGIVFVGTVGETVQEWQLGGWLPTTPVGVHIPGWVGTWLATFPTAEGLIRQGLALAFVVGSYLIAEELRYRRPVRKGARPAARLTLRRRHRRVDGCWDGAADAARAHSAPPEGSRPKDTGGATPATDQVSPECRQMAIFGRQFLGDNRPVPRPPRDTDRSRLRGPWSGTGPHRRRPPQTPAEPRPDPVGRTLPGTAGT